MMPHHAPSRPAPAFTLVDTMLAIVVLAVVAAVVIPRFAGARERAVEGNLSAQLSTIRNQIRLHDMAHPDRPFNPLVPGGSKAWDQLVKNNYLLAPPRNPLQANSFKVRALPAAGVGWVWKDLGDGRTIYALDESGAYYDGDGDGLPD
jgi:type II secretory pathway pseudopilin PulG